jgi:hypothetical protein
MEPVMNSLTPKPENLPAELLDLMASDCGRGVSLAGEDQLPSMLLVGQNNTPACDKNDEKYIDGCEPGDFILRVGGVSTRRSGIDGVTVIPCKMTLSWVGWRAQRQGFLFRSLQKPEGLVETIEHDENGRARSVMKLGDDVVQQSRDIFMLVADEQGNWQPFMMPNVSTFNTFARGWNTYWHSIRHPKSGGVMPAYSHQYLLTTFRRHNALGRWYMPKYADCGVVTDMAVFTLAREFNRIIEGQTGSNDMTRPAA